MTGLLEAPDRQDLHNSSTNFAVALTGGCGYTHLQSGRTCLLPHRHVDRCQMVIPTDEAGSRAKRSTLAADDPQDLTG